MQKDLSRTRLRTGVALFALAATLVHAAPALAEDAARIDPIVTTATKTATKLSDVPASVTVITSEEIESQGNASVAQIISRSIGVNSWGSGGVGTAASVQMRGMEEEHTLLLIDGVRMNNPADSNGRGAANFDNVITHNIERIEIVRGPMASLYGSNASGGVVNIITKKAAQDGYHGAIKGEYGSFNTRRLDASISYGGKIDQMPFTLSYAHSEFMADGPNVSDEKRQFAAGEVHPSEDDRRIIYDHSLDFRLSPTADVDGRVFFSVNDASVDLDSSGADADRNKDSRTYNYGSVWDTRMLDGRLENKDAVYGMNMSQRLIYNNQKPREAYAYRGDFLQFEHLSTYALSRDHKITGGLAYDRSRAERKANMRQTVDRTISHGTTSLQLQSKFFDDLKVTNGISYESYGPYENTLTYRAGAAYDIRGTGTTLRAGAGTGYRAPSVFQEYVYANPKELKPEESVMYEAGFDQKLFDGQVKLSVMAFRNELENAIRYLSGAGLGCNNAENKCYVNADEMTTQGLETSVDALLYQGESDSLDAHIGYTYTVSQFTDKTNQNHQSDKAPPHVANASLIYGFDHGRGSVRADGTIKSRGWEAYHKGANSTAYDGDGWKVDLAAQYEILEGLTAYGRVENLFDQEWYTSSGYTDSPFGVYVGLGYKF